MGKFAADLSAFAKKTNAIGNAVVGKIVTDIATELVEKSPVGDAKYWQSKPPEGYVGGRFRGNWFYGEGEPDTSISEAIDPTGEITIATIVGKIGDSPYGKIHYITNSLPYAIPLEEGHSYRQAPNGMVGITVLEFEPIVAKAARALS